MQWRQRTRTCLGAGRGPALFAFLRARFLGMGLVTAACLLAAGCSPGVEAPPGPPFPAIFPTAHDGPPPRADTPMNPVEVQKATEDLITDRDRLNAQAPPGQAQAAPGAAKAKGTAKTTSTAAAKPKHRPAKGAPQQTAAVPSATTASAQGAGMQAAGSSLKP